jgi:YD repeat-containing protein
MDMPVSVKQPNGGVWKYEYDESGNLTRRINPEGRETRYMWESGLLKEIADMVSGSTLLNYDSYHALSQITYPDRSRETWRRNLHGKATEHRNVKNAVTRYKYDAAGRMQEVFLPDGNLVSYSYDEAGNLAGIKDRDRQVHARYDLFGNIVQRSEGNTTLTFGYDREGRLSVVTNEAWEQYALEHDGEGDLYL